MTPSPRPIPRRTDRRQRGDLRGLTNYRLLVRWTEAERLILEESAQAEHVTMAEFIRRCVWARIGPDAQAALAAAHRPGGAATRLQNMTRPDHVPPDPDLEF